jgi:hypothetical protein
MTKSHQELAAEVSDLTARSANLERWERARLVQARIELANTSEAREESARQNQRAAAIFTAAELDIVRALGLAD